jgi:hypothetical protein
VEAQLITLLLQEIGCFALVLERKSHRPGCVVYSSPFCHRHRGRPLTWTGRC